jgi:hypothetical protein
MLAQAYNFSTQEAEAREDPEFEVSVGYRVKSYLV